MATTFPVLQGKAKWVKIKAPNKYGKWSLDLYINPENVEIFKSFKVMNHLKKDEDGYYVTFSRPTARQLRNGQSVPMVPVIVLDKDGLPYDGHIGNGSDITLKLELYTFILGGDPQGGKKNACRMNTIRVDNLVKFDDKSRTEEEIKELGTMKPYAF